MTDEQTWTIDGDEYVLATGDDAHEVSANNDARMRLGVIYVDSEGVLWRKWVNSITIRSSETGKWFQRERTLYCLRDYGPFRALTKVAPAIPGGFTVGQKVRVVSNDYLDRLGRLMCVPGARPFSLRAEVVSAAQDDNVLVRYESGGEEYYAPTSLVPAYEAGDEVPAEHITHLPDGTLLRQRNPEASSGWLVMEGELRRIHADGDLGIGNYSGFTFEDVTWTVTYTPEATS